MISVPEAKHRILNSVVHLNAAHRPLASALGCTAAGNIVAPIHLPPFRQSAMDGYAISPSEPRQTSFTVTTEIPAGSVLRKPLHPGEAARIFTGACVPDQASAVIKQESVTVAPGNHITINEDYKIDDNIRAVGSQIRQGETAIPAGTVLTPAGIGLCAALGLTGIAVYPKPRIAIIVTGSELRQPGTPLDYGTVYESNSFALTAVLASVGITDITVSSVSDDKLHITEAIQNALGISDIVLVTGGVSVGDYDFVGPAMADIGVETIFYKVRQKPGKPLFYGRHNTTAVFGLPGNPAAVLSCFYEYVYPAIQLMQGRQEPFLPSVRLPIAQSYRKSNSLALFLKGRAGNGSVKPLGGQESYILKSFAEGNCLIYLPEAVETIAAGDPVEVHMLPGVYYP
ncbi:MAG: Molybdopterin biosynthesis enzyme MoeA [Chlorobi bacterium OLB6]|nr:MAG: Molybdopterin biosynthesis enzyme MoeA [Chlorobi bacterium OLB6]